MELTKSVLLLWLETLFSRDSFDSFSRLKFHLTGKELPMFPRLSLTGKQRRSQRHLENIESPLTRACLQGKQLSRQHRQDRLPKKLKQSILLLLVPESSYSLLPFSWSISGFITKSYLLVEASSKNVESFIAFLGQLSAH